MSTNITANFHFEILNVIKGNLEIEFIPFLYGAGLGYYLSSISDNCLWVLTENIILQVNTKLTKKIAKCTNKF